MIGKRLLIRPITLLFLLGLVITDRTGIGATTIFAAALHELGHLMAARCMGIPLKNIRLDLLGARIEIGGRMLSYGEEWLLAAAGPLTSLIVSLGAAPFWQLSTHAVTFSCASVILGGLNLLPIRTFDGGRMLETTLMRFTTPRICRRFMNLCTLVFLFLLWAVAVYFLLRANEGLSLMCFSMSLIGRYFDRGNN